MRVARPIAGLFLAVLLVAGCSGDGGTGSKSPSLTGTWGHTDPALPALGILVTLTLVEGEGGAVSGSGQILSNGPRNVSITGIHNNPNVSLTLSGGTSCTGSFTGTFSDNNTITGTTTRSAGDCRAGTWTLKRQ